MQSYTASIVIIGNEILSGRTQDSNTAWLASRLNSLGIRLLEVRIIPDIPTDIQETVRAMRSKYTYVFTTGGIGPTHDDITTENIAIQAGVPLILHPDAKAMLVKHYNGEEHLNAARLKMAMIPEGATLIPNPVSGAPGFKLDNVFVMAGVPSIMQGMFDAIAHTLKGGKPMLSVTLSAYVTEGVIAQGLSDIQAQFPNTDIGSYPFVKQGRLGTSLVVRCTDEQPLKAAAAEIEALLLLHVDSVEIAQT